MGEMRAVVLEQSYLLGRIVGLLQVLEETVGGVAARGEHWGEYLLPLFMANMESSMQLAGRLVGQLDVSEGFEFAGRRFSLDDVKIILEKLDMEVLKEEIVEGEYVRGYHHWYEEVGEVLSDVDIFEEVLERAGSPSYSLGIFLGNLKCMEEDIALATGLVPECRIENIMLLLEVNYESSMGIVDMILRKLPDTVVFRNRELSIEQLKKARVSLQENGMSGGILLFDEVKEGYEFQRRKLGYDESGGKMKEKE